MTSIDALRPARRPAAPGSEADLAPQPWKWVVCSETGLLFPALGTDKDAVAAFYVGADQRIRFGGAATPEQLAAAGVMRHALGVTQAFFDHPTPVQATLTRLTVNRAIELADQPVYRRSPDCA